MERDEIEDGSGTESLLDRREHGKISNGPVAAAEGRATPILILSIFAVTCSSFDFGWVVGYSSPTESGIKKDLGLTVAEYSLFGSLLTIGGMLGALSCGKLSDLIGRKWSLFVLNITYIIGWLAIVFAKAAWLLDIGRLILGVAIGINMYLGPVYVAEITPKNLRGALVSLTQMIIGFSISFSYIVGSVVSWRVLALIGVIPCLIQLPLLFFIPESPRWLANVGREKDFEATLQRLRGSEADVSDEAAEIRDYTESVKHVARDGITELFQRKYAYSIIIGVGLMVLQQLGGVNGYTFYTSVIFESAGIPIFIGFVTVAIVQILMNIIGTILMDKSGRRPLLLISEVGLCLGCLLTALSFIFQDFSMCTKATPILALISVLIYNGSYALGMGGIPWIIASEIFPINVKGLAGSICNLVNWICSWIVAYAFEFLLDWSSAGTFLIFAAITGSGILFLAKLVPETKGRTLEEIQASLNKFP